MIENDLPPPYEVAIGTKQDNGIVKGPPPSYDLIGPVDDTRIRIENDAFNPELSASANQNDEPTEISSLSCIVIAMLIAACVTVFVLGFRKDKK